MQILEDTKDPADKTTITKNGIKSYIFSLNGTINSKIKIHKNIPIIEENNSLLKKNVEKFKGLYTFIN